MCINASICFGQDLEWTGNAGNLDFFDENNWLDIVSNTIPPANSLIADMPIDLNLKIQNTTQSIFANGTIHLGTGSLTLIEANLSAHSLENGTITLGEEAYLTLSSALPILGNAQFNFTSSNAWLKTEDLKPSEVDANYLDSFKVNQQNAVYQSNMRLDNFYAEGCIIRPQNLSNPLTIFSQENYDGVSSTIAVDTVFSADNIPGGLNNSINSFQLKKGYMVTLAVNADGTGMSKNYIASEENLEITKLPKYLRNSISFIRVSPWNWVNKKGKANASTTVQEDMDNAWFYNWNRNLNSSFAVEYVPMSWGAGGANDDADIALYQSKYKATHVLGFNESDNCNGQSGQYNNLCQVDVAVGYYRNLMKTGLRLVSPSGRENAPFGWLKDFYDKANEEDVRIDVIGVHWYDWGSNPQNSPNANPNAVFQRFVTYLQNVYDLYGLPIWITEFNANPNRTGAVNFQFMQLALPYLESLDYVERYVWFEPNSGVADYYDSNTNLTNVGTLYKNQVSTPSISIPTVSANSNLDNYAQLLDPTGENLLVNGFFETQDLTGWNGSNIAILNNAFDGESSGRIMANPGMLYQDVEVEGNTIYDLSFYTKWYVPPNNPIEIKILNADTGAIIASQMMGTSTSWNLVGMQFTTPSNVNTIRVLIEKGNNPGWFIDNAILLKNQTLSTQVFHNTFNVEVYPNPTHAKINIESIEEIDRFEVFDMHARKVHQNLILDSKSIDLSTLKKGFYVLRLYSTKGQVFNKKIIVN